MAKPPKGANSDGTTSLRAYWSAQIEKGCKRYRQFWDDGRIVVDEYRRQTPDGSARSGKDKYNILYSSTETIRPNLYAQMPKVRAVLRNKDIAPPYARDGAELMQRCAQYVIEEGKFDDVMTAVVEDLLLPGLGQGWVRYEPTIEYEYEEDGKTPKINPETGEQIGRLLDEQICTEYVFWKDFITGPARVWKDVPWVAKRCWMTKEQAKNRFGDKKANAMTYVVKERDGRNEDVTEDTAEVWEIWDKRTKTAYWYSDSFKGDLLDKREDPLRLKDFFPCPKPLRAVTTTSNIVPRALYAQYKEQAEQVNNLTRRIRLLTDALKVVGAYNASEAAMADIISPNSGNKMVAIQNWHDFTGSGGVLGAVQWLPLADVVNALAQLLQAREVAKAEIYEITGFSDILRGVSKASETLGAQNIKANWGSARLKVMQKEVQRFARDMIALIAEIVSEHVSPESILLFGGVIIPNDPQAAAPVIQRAQAAIQFIREEAPRVATIDVETDSTLLADEQTEREDRTQFMTATASFLQQAVPAVEAVPELGGLMAALLMFGVRSFPSSRPIEDAFEQVAQAMQNRPPKQPEQPDQTRVQAAQMQLQARQAEIASREKMDMARLQAEQQARADKHALDMATLELKREELDLKRQELELKVQEAYYQAEQTDREQTLDEEVAAHDAAIDDAQIDLEYDWLDAEAEAAEADRDAAREQALTDEGEQA